MPRLELNPADAEKLGSSKVTGHGSRLNRIPTWVSNTVREFVSASICTRASRGWANAEHAWWFPELPAPTHGFKLSNAECLWDPCCRQVHQLHAHARRALQDLQGNAGKLPRRKVIPCATEDGTEIIHDSSDARLKEWLPDYEIRKEA